MEAFWDRVSKYKILSGNEVGVGFSDCVGCGFVIGYHGWMCIT